MQFVLVSLFAYKGEAVEEVGQSEHEHKNQGYHRGTACQTRASFQLLDCLL